MNQKKYLKESDMKFHKWIIILFIMFLAACANSFDNKIYSVTFNTDGGTEISSVNINQGHELDLPEPMKEGHDFIGWFFVDSPDEIIKSTSIIITKDTALKAMWQIGSFSIIFSDMDILPITQDYQTQIFAPNEPQLNGYSFGGWYSDSQYLNEFTFSLMPGKDVVLYAKWMPNPYQITFDKMDGTPLDVRNYEFDSALEDLSIPSRQDYTFIAWYLDSNHENQLNINKMPAEDLTLFALWESKLYRLTYKSTNFITMVQTKRFHTALITSDNQVYTWGRNGSGQLGNGTNFNATEPENITHQFQLENNDYISMILTGQDFTAALSSQGRLFTWGFNANGQLGTGNTDMLFNPNDITNRFNLMSNERFITLSLGYWHTAAVTSEGRLFTWGFNAGGQLGVGTVEQRENPTDITPLFNLRPNEKIIDVELSHYHSAALTSDGRIFMWGFNGFGTLGDGTNIMKTVPIDITFQFPIGTNDRIIQISLGQFHSSALTAQGRVFMWGSNNRGQLGHDMNVPFVNYRGELNQPTEITHVFNLTLGEKITSISLGEMHSGAITSKGNIFTWGENEVGQLGNGVFEEYQRTPKSILSFLKLMDNEKVDSIHLGDRSTFITTTFGRVLSWGDNANGKLGGGPLDNRSIAMDISDSFIQWIEMGYQTLTVGSPLELLTLEPLRGDYLGWFTDQELNHLFMLDEMPSGDLTIYTRGIFLD